MISKLRRFLGLETDDEKLIRLTDISKSLQDVYLRIDESAEEFTSENEAYKAAFKDKTLDESIRKSLETKYSYFIEEQKKSVQELMKERRELQKEHKELISEPTLLKAVKEISFYEGIKEKYKSGELTPFLYNTILKAKKGKVKYADNIVFNKKGEILLLQRTNTEDDKNGGLWVIPGGHVDEGEEFFEAARRELQEESGINSEDCKEIGKYEDEDCEIHYFKIELECENEQPIILQNGESMDFKWVSIWDLDDYKFPFNMLQNIKQVLDLKDEKIVSISKAVKSGILDRQFAFELIEKAFKDGLIDESILEKARSGTYKDTAENRSKGIVGQKYGSTKAAERKDDWVDLLKKKEQYAKEVLNPIYQKGVDYIEESLKGSGFEVEGISRSVTSFGQSWYLKLKGGFEGQQIRISDHSVGDRRLMNDPTIAYINYKNIDDEGRMKEVMDSVKSQLNKQVDIIEKRKEETANYKKEYSSIQEESENFISDLKKENKAIFNSNRTKQSLEEIKSKHPDWEHIKQNEESGGAFNYDYIKTQNGYGQYNLGVRKDYFNFLKEKGLIDESNSIQKSLTVIELAYLEGDISEEIFEKARSGKYADTPENKRLKRVGQDYGSKKQEEVKETDKNNEETDSQYQETKEEIKIEQHARNASEQSLINASKSGDEAHRIAAKHELERRNKEENPENNSKSLEDTNKQLEKEVKSAEKESNKEEKVENKNVSLDSLNQKLREDYKKVTIGLSNIEDYSSNEFTELNNKQKELSRYVQLTAGFTEKRTEADKKELSKYFNIDSEDKIKDVFGDGEILGLQVEQEGDLLKVCSITEDCFVKRYFNKKEGIVNMEELFLHPNIEKGKGSGLNIFENQIDKYKELGFNKLKNLSASGINLNGGYTWARIGYVFDKEGDSLGADELQFKHTIKSSNIDKVKNSKDLQELLSTKEGIDFWKENHFTFNGLFDLDENSYSMKTYKKYKDGKGNK